MKKFFAMLLACLLIASCACADEIDLSSLSFDELRELQTEISKELIKRPEWKEVNVPAGFYKIGEDIPAGDWCIKCGNADEDHIFVDYGKANESESKVDDSDWYGNIYIKASDSDIDHKNIKLIEGNCISIHYGSAIFTIPVKEDLGF